MKDNNFPDFAFWNALEKPDNVSVEAEENDIVQVINGIAFLCQTQNGYNNIVAIRVEPSDKNVVWTFLEFCKLLYTKYKIQYIRVEGDKNKYKFIERFFSKNQAIRDRSIKNRDVYYCNLKEAYQKLDYKCKEFEFYYNQSMYLKTNDKQYFDKMFLAVHFAVETNLKKKYSTLKRQGIKRNDFEDMHSTVTLAIMERYNKPNGYYIRHLLTVVELAIFGILHSKKQRFLDSMLSYEAWVEYEVEQ